MLARGPFAYLIGAVCILVAISMPPLELVPFANTTTVAALTAFGLALIAHDGLIAVLGLARFVGSLVSVALVWNG